MRLFKIVRGGESSAPAEASKKNISIAGLKPENLLPPTIPANFVTPPNLFSSSQGIGLFSSPGQTKNIFDNNAAKPAAKEGAAPANPAEKSLFGSNSLFSSAFQSKPSTFNIFGNAPTLNNPLSTPTSNSIFGSIPNNLFSKAEQPAPADGEEEGDSAELEKAQNMDADPSKSTKKFEYPTEGLLSSLKVLKFKKDGGNLIENVVATLLHDSKSNVTTLVVRLVASQSVIFNGFILPGKSTVRHINNKSDSLEILAFTIENQESTGHRLKMTFGGAKEAIEKMETQLNQIIEGKISKKE